LKKGLKKKLDNIDTKIREENNNLISIIVPVYNAERFIRDTIKTVQNQTYKNWELILINDCSTDNSANIIKEYLSDKIKLIELQENSGAAICRNTGIDNARGRYIAFLDSDDLWVENKLEKQEKFMKEKNCAFSFTGYEFANEYGTPNGIKVYVPGKLNYKQALKNTTIWTSTVMFDLIQLNKSIIKMPNLRRGQDTATWWKILKTGVEAYGLNEVLSFYRRGIGQTLSSNKIIALKRTWNLYRKQEKLNVFKTMYYFTFYLFNTIRRRI